MRATIRDLDVLRAVRPLELLAYLRSHGWEQAEQLRQGAVWIKQQESETFDILLPLDATLRDFGYRIAEALQTLEQVEKRSQLEIVEDLSLVNADVIRPRLPGADHSGEISVQQGSIVYEQARNLLLAAACAAVDRRAVYASRKPEIAMQFLDHARFGIPQRGSYVLTIISPVSPAIPLAETEPVPPYEPFARRAVRTLAEALQRLESAARETVATRSFDPMNSAVDYGVSANLCEALVGLHQGSGERGVEFAFSWASTRPVSASVPRSSSFSPDFMSVIGETARIFRETAPLPGVEVVGVVKRLDHLGDHGLITLVGTIDGQSRNVSMHLSGGDHSLAVRSYEERLPIACTGELTREGRSWILKNPREVKLLGEDAGNL